MSMYNMAYGCNQATFLLLPMLGKHADEYPRFRDCFPGTVSNSDTLKDRYGIPQKITDLSRPIISVYMRVGGDNRPEYRTEIANLRNSPGYIRDKDDNFDPTYAIFEFEVPEQFRNDFDLVINGQFKNTSGEYKAICKRVYPKLADQLEQLFNDQLSRGSDEQTIN